MKPTDHERETINAAAARLAHAFKQAREIVDDDLCAAVLAAAMALSADGAEIADSLAAIVPPADGADDPDDANPFEAAQ